MEALIADTNVLLRLLTKGPESLYRAVRAWILRAEAEGRILEVHAVHVAEALYVLEGRIYGVPRAQAAQELGLLLSTQPFRVREEGVLRP
ncbi:hypothetical protein FJNA_16100 [Thermus sp. FJN-A]